MSRERGTVVEKREAMVLVEASDESGCSSCEARHSCMLGSDKRTRRIWIEDTLGASVGDIVVFSIRGSGVVAASIIIYLLPVMMLIAGTAAGTLSHGAFLLGREVSAILGGVAGLAASVIAIFLISRKTRKSRVFKPILVTVIDCKNNKPMPGVK